MTRKKKITTDAEALLIKQKIIRQCIQIVNTNNPNDFDESIKEVIDKYVGDLVDYKEEEHTLPNISYVSDKLYETTNGKLEGIDWVKIMIFLIEKCSWNDVLVDMLVSRVYALEEEKKTTKAKVDILANMPDDLYKTFTSMNLSDLNAFKKQVLSVASEFEKTRKTSNSSSWERPTIDYFDRKYRRRKDG